MCRYSLLEKFKYNKKISLINEKYKIIQKHYLYAKFSIIIEINYNNRNKYITVTIALYDDIVSQRTRYTEDKHHNNQ